MKHKIHEIPYLTVPMKQGDFLHSCCSYQTSLITKLSTPQELNYVVIFLAIKAQSNLVKITIQSFLYLSALLIFIVILATKPNERHSHVFTDRILSRRPPLSPMASKQANQNLSLNNFLRAVQLNSGKTQQFFSKFLNTFWISLSGSSIN